MKTATSVLSVKLCAVCLFHFAAASAEPPKEAEMKNPGADETPERVVLDGVPKVRYFKDGMCPFALCLKVWTDFLGQDFSYNYILGTSGACFRMTWNFTEWDEGNMDLARLGPEPFRHAFRAVGLEHRFLLKKSWWPDATGDDIEMLGDKTAEATFRARIVQSIRGNQEKPSSQSRTMMSPLPCLSARFAALFLTFSMMESVYSYGRIPS